VLLGLCLSHRGLRDERAGRVLRVALDAALELADAAAAAPGSQAAWPALCRLERQLSSLADAARARPRAWGFLCTADETALPALARAALGALAPPAAAAKGVELLRLALQDAPAGLEMDWLGLPLPEPEARPDGGHLPALAAALAATPLARFIAAHALEAPSEGTRVTAATCVHLFARRLALPARRQLLLLLLAWLPRLAPYGPDAEPLCGAAAQILGESGGAVSTAALGTLRGPEAARLAGSLTAALRAAAEAVVAHPSAPLYAALRRLTEFGGHHLELEASDVAAAPPPPPAAAAPPPATKVDTLKAEIRYTDRRVLLRLAGLQTISALALAVDAPRRTKSVKTLDVYYTAAPVSDLQSLKASPGRWTHALRVGLAPRQAALRAPLPLPLTASCLMIEFSELHESLHEQSMELMQCPRRAVALHARSARAASAAPGCPEAAPFPCCLAAAACGAEPSLPSSAAPCCQTPPPKL
jgi:E3 ubiquitin-protein ligase UBR4